MASFIFRDRKSVSAVCGGDPDDKKNLRTTGDENYQLAVALAE